MTVIEFLSHTDRSDSQLSWVITKNYSTAPRVTMGVLGSVCDPRTQIWGFGARPSTFKGPRTKKPLKKSHTCSKTAVFGWFFRSSSSKP